MTAMLTASPMGRPHRNRRTTAARVAKTRRRPAPRSGGGIIVEGDDSYDTDGLDADDNMHSGQQLPDDFPIPVPDRYQVEAVGEAGNETAVILRVPSGEDAYNYYRHFLADEGFRLVDEGRSQGGFLDAEV